MSTKGMVLLYMMKILKFNLSGEFAFFKNPIANSYANFTFGHIHKIALAGVLGAIVGMDGYKSIKIKKEKLEDYPEFWEQLKDMNVAIVPKNQHGNIAKKIQIFTNTVGYASQEEGGVLIVREQWLENPSWDIYLEINNEVTEKIAEYIMNNKAIYLPYLGKNDHPADISDMEIITDAEEVTDEYVTLDSLFIEDEFEIEKKKTGLRSKIENSNERTWKYKEVLPMALGINFNEYIYKTIVLTNAKVKGRTEGKKTYRANETTIAFL